MYKQNKKIVRRDIIYCEERSKHLTVLELFSWRWFSLRDHGISCIYTLGLTLASYKYMCIVIGLLRKMQILKPLQFRLSVFYHFTVDNEYRKCWKFCLNI